MKKSTILLGFILIILEVVVVVSCKSSDAPLLASIQITPDKVLGAYDLANDVETTFDIIPLETNDSCLVGNIQRIIFQNNKYYILDNNHTITIFDNTGKFNSVFNKRGRAPGEYKSIRDFVVIEDNIWIYDEINQSLSCFDSKFNKKDEYKVKTTFNNIANIGDIIYGAGKWLGYEPENFQVLEYDTRNKKITQHLEYPAQNQQYIAFGKKDQLASTLSNCLFIQPYCDTIFELIDGTVIPKYQYNFSERFIDKRFTEFEEALKAQQNKMIIGIEGIYQTDKSVIILYVDQQDGRFAIYNKNSETCNVYDYQLKNSRLGNLKTMSISFTPNNEIITTYEAHNLLNYSQNIFDKNKFQNIEDLQKIECIIKGLKEDDNPIIFKYKIKEDSKL